MKPFFKKEKDQLEWQKIPFVYFYCFFGRFVKKKHITIFEVQKIFYYYVNWSKVFVCLFVVFKKNFFQINA